MNNQRIVSESQFNYFMKTENIYFNEELIDNPNIKDQIKEYYKKLKNNKKFNNVFTGITDDKSFGNSINNINYAFLVKKVNGKSNYNTNMSNNSKFFSSIKNQNKNFMNINNNKNYKDIKNLKGKRVLLRLDLNISITK